MIQREFIESLIRDLGADFRVSFKFALPRSDCVLIRPLWRILKYDCIILQFGVPRTEEEWDYVVRWGRTTLPHGLFQENDRITSVRVVSRLPTPGIKHVGPVQRGRQWGGRDALPTRFNEVTFDKFEATTNFANQLGPPPAADITQTQVDAPMAGDIPGVGGGMNPLPAPPPQQAAMGKGQQPTGDSAYSGIDSVIQKLGGKMYDPATIQAELAVQLRETPGDLANWGPKGHKRTHPDLPPDDKNLGLAHRQCGNGF